MADMATEKYKPFNISAELSSDKYWELAIDVTECWLEYLKARDLYQMATRDSTRSSVWSIIVDDYDGKISKVYQREYRFKVLFENLLDIFLSFCRVYRVKSSNRNDFSLGLGSIESTEEFLSKLKQKKKLKLPACALTNILIK